MDTISYRMAEVQAEQKLIDRAQQKLEKRKRFEAVFPMLVDEIMAYCTTEGSEYEGFVTHSG